MCVAVGYSVFFQVVQMVKQQEVTEPMQASQEGDFLKVDRGPTPRSNSPLEVSLIQRLLFM